jgi:UDPglucose 6-dehydrogenase
MQRPAKPFTPVRFRLQPPKKIMKIAIIGYGFVGQALENGLSDVVDVFNVDPKLKTSIEDLNIFEPDAIFICVPTPMHDNHTQDISILKKVLSQLIKLNNLPLIILKSTVLPNHITEIEKFLPNIVYNPEFLREKHAYDDFLNSNLIVFGGKKTPSELASNIYKKYTKCICKDYVFTDIVAASFIKYTINSFLATKVVFFNELKQVYDSAKVNENWDEFISILSKDNRIGGSHMSVPGHDGRLGFGGACLPKDSSAFNLYASSLGVSLSLLNKAINTNNQIRAEYNGQTDREIEQNINYNGDTN